MPSITARGQHTEKESHSAWRRLNAPSICSGMAQTFVVAPDIVAGGVESLRLTESWMHKLAHLPVLVAVQDGISHADVAPWLSERVGLFVGGSTAWKLQTMPGWCALARSRGAWCHVGRVNSALRMRLCLAAGARSFDGSGASRFTRHAELLTREHRAHLNLW